MVNFNPNIGASNIGGINRAPRSGGQDHNMPDPGTTTVEPSVHLFYDRKGNLIDCFYIDDGIHKAYIYSQGYDTDVHGNGFDRSRENGNV